MLKTVSTEALLDKLIDGAALIDVRAEVEFSQGALPQSVNLPILDNNERAEIGTLYKKSGREKAIARGYEIVSGENKNKKIQQWLNVIEKNPNCILTCFRGGLRSQIAQQFIKESGHDIARAEKGYKEMRLYLSEQLREFATVSSMKLLTGTTGSGKTAVLKLLENFYPVVDLEQLARHRGSAFGQMSESQPAQATFENAVTFDILKTQKTFQSSAPLLFEDESRNIGGVHLPDKLFIKMRASSVIRLNCELEERVQNIYQDYIVQADPEIFFEKYNQAIRKIEKKLGTKRVVELLVDLQKAEWQRVRDNDLQLNKVWIEKLLVWYYDPLYLSSLKRREPAVDFQGNAAEVVQYFKALSAF